MGVSVHDVQHLFKIVANANDEVDIDRCSAGKWGGKWRGNWVSWKNFSFCGGKALKIFLKGLGPPLAHGNGHA